MNYVEYVGMQTVISFNDAIELVTPLYLRAILWNPNSDLSKVKADAVQFIEDTIKSNSEYLDAKPDFEYIEDQEGNPVIDHEGNQLRRLNRNRSTVDCKQLLNLFHHNFVRLNYIVPDEIEELLKIKMSEHPPATKSNCNDIVGAVEDEEIPEDIKKMSIPTLRKKVTELSNEKIKWDKSIVAALHVGLLINKKEFTTDITEKAFTAEFENELKGLHKKTVKMIHQAIPANYRNLGGSPTKVPEGIDDNTLDIIIESSAFAGYLSHREGIEVLDELEERLIENEYEMPTDNYLTAIKKACKKVIKKYV